MKYLILFVIILFSPFVSLGQKSDKQLSKAYIYYENNNYESALFELENYLKKNTDNAVAYLLRGLLYQSLEMPQDAILNQYDRAIALDSTFTDAYARRGDLKLKIKDYQGALNDFNKANYLKPNNDYVLFKLGLIHGLLNKFEMAKQYLVEAIEVNPQNYEAIFHRGIIHIQFNDYEAAFKDFDNCIKGGVVNNYIYLNRGIAQCMTQKFDAALIDLNRSIAIDASNNEAYFWKGFAEVNIGHIEIGFENINFALKTDTTNASRHYYKGGLLFDMGRFKEATEALNTAEKIDPSDPKTLLLRGKAYYNLHNYSAAENDFKKTLSINPDTAEVYFFLSMIYFLKNDMSKALFYINNALDLEQNINFYLHRGHLLYTEFKYDKAMADINKSIEIDSLSSEAYYFKGKILSDSGNKKAAIEAYTKTIALDPEHADAYYYRACIYFLWKDVVKGCPDLKKSIALGREDYSDFLSEYCR